MPWPKGKKHSDQTLKKMSDALTGKEYPNRARPAEPRSDESRKRTSDALVGRAFRHTTESARRCWTGGEFGEVMAKILTPCGYVREQRIYWGPLEHDHFVVDFVQLDAKTVIELDGPYHRTNKSEEDDALRDATLNALGFRVIRIKHDQ